ncbi:MAG: lipocalin family protein [Ignavibacteriaceae bacterium]|nr:lipocalin family protein [Ignavibacteriaceae bacterium]
MSPKLNGLVFGLILIATVTLFIGCSSSKYPPLQTVESVDLKKYVGKWYEIASFPQSFQKGCNCTTAEYFLTDKDYIRVLNSCNRGSSKGKLDQAEGKAFVIEGSNNSKLKVQFFWPFKGDYWIIELADDYSYAVVGHPGREYLWILSRTPQMEESTYQMLLQRISAKQFDISKLNRTNQDCSK